jgi:amino acid adenylation domain-containing protein
MSVHIQIIKQNRSKKVFPLSYGQEHLWLIDRLGTGSPQYNLINASLIKGQLDKDVLEKSLNMVIEKHEALRTVFIFRNEEVGQIVLDKLTLPIEFINITGDSSEMLDAIVDRESSRIFDLSSGPLLHVMLIKISPDEHVFLVNIHHIISDGWSIQLLLKEIVSAYISISGTGNSFERHLPFQYVDYATWQREFCASDLVNNHVEYWKKCLDTIPSLLSLPTDFTRPKIQGFCGNVYRFELDPQITKQLVNLCRAEKVTLFILLLTCFKLLLYRYTGEEDIVVGTPISGRDIYETEFLIGYFVNTLVLRTSLSGSLTFRELLKRITSVVLDAYEHQRVPFEKVVEAINPERNLGYSPVFQIFFSLYSKQVHDVELEGLTITPFPIKRKMAKFDLSFEIEEYKGIIWVDIEYRTDLFNQTTIENMSRHYINILDWVVGRTDNDISQIPILSQSELKKVLIETNRSDMVIPSDKCIHQLFEEQAKLHPNKIAVTVKGKSLTYGELDNRANLVALNLKNMGADTEDCIGVCMGTGINMLPVLIGILKAGCCYLPLDPNMPAVRMEAIIENACPRLVIVENGIQKISRIVESANIILTENLFNETPVSKSLNVEVSPSNLAYIIYTSGSTGEPKGVEITHYSVVNLLYSMKNEPGMNENDRLLSVTSFIFDISVLEMFLPLIAGGEVIFVERDECLDGIKIKENIKQYKPTVMQATPATWRILASTDWEGDRHGLKILCGGEALDKNLAEKLLGFGKEVWNMYGPTETTVWSMIYKLTGEEEEIPIGYPIANTKIYILLDLCKSAVKT